jgi:hypothetical protein
MIIKTNGKINLLNLKKLMANRTVPSCRKAAIKYIPTKTK